MNSFIEYIHCSLVLRIIRYWIDSSNSFWFTKFIQNIVFELSSFISLMSIRNIMCDDAFFRPLRWSQFSYQFVELSIHTLWNYPLLQDRVSPLWIQARAGLKETEVDLLWIRSFMWFCPGKTKLDLPKSS